MKSFRILISLLILNITYSGLADTREQIMLVFDASGSMWGRVEGRPKIQVAKDALRSLVKDLSKDKDLGLIVYGHRKKDDCGDIELLTPVGSLDSNGIDQALEKIVPKGRTPITESIRTAAESLKYTENKATVVLISDGIETCNADPCKLAKELEELGVDFTAHVIGFDLKSEEDKNQLRCLADNTGGKFITANSLNELNIALEETIKVNPTPEPIEAKLHFSESAIKGTELAIKIEAPLGFDGYVYLFKKGGEKSITYSAVRESSYGDVYEDVKLRLPAVTGDFELRWISSKNQKLAEGDLKIIDAQISLEAPPTAIMGTEISVKLNAPPGLQGYLYLYKEGKTKSISYHSVREGKIEDYDPVKVRLPIVTGNFIIKWQNYKNEILAETKIEITPAEVSMALPDSVKVEEDIKITLNAPKGIGGYIYLFHEGSNKSLSYYRVSEGKYEDYNPITVKGIKKAGKYQVKWMPTDKEVLVEKALTVE